MLRVRKGAPVVDSASPPTGSHPKIRVAASDDVTDEEDVPSARSGVITGAAAFARDIRDVVTEPTETQPKAGAGAGGDLPPRRTRSGVVGVLAGLLGLSTGFGGMELRLRWTGPSTEAQIDAAEAQARTNGRVDELSNQVRQLRAEASSDRADDLQRDYDQAMTFRALDGNLGALLDKFEVPIGARTKLDASIEARHDRAIAAYEESVRESQRRALAATVADRDTVGTP
jgi:hypothetical protein